MFIYLTSRSPHIAASRFEGGKHTSTAMSSKLSTLFGTAMRTISGASFQVTDVAGNVLLITNVASY